MSLYSELFRLAIRNTRRRGKRTWLTMIGVIIGVTAIISLVALGQGLEQAIVQEFEELGANFIYVSGDVDKSDIDVVDRAIGAENAVGFVEVTAQADFREDTQFITVFGVDTREFDNFRQSQGLSVEEGRELRPNDLTSVLVGPNIKSDVFERETEIRSQLEIENQRFSIIGFLGDTGDPRFQESIIMDIDRTREILDLEDDKIDQISVSVQPGFEQEEVQENIEAEMRRDRNVREGEEDFSTITPDDILDALQGILNVVQTIVIGIASIALFVGGIGIMNTTYMSITERTQEIGVMKAIGAKKRHISTLFLFEAGIIGAIGSLIGLLLGLGLSNLAIYAVDTYTDFGAAQIFSLELAVAAVLFGFMLGVVSGILPARKAANMDPAESLRYE